MWGSWEVEAEGWEAQGPSLASLGYMRWMNDLINE